MDFVTIDGSEGEGGGQMLRTSLALAILTGRPLRLVNVRARRSTPGLGRQHLASLRAAQAISGATVRGDALRSTEVELVPGAARAGEHTFAIGSAGSATLVLQTVLPPLLLASAPSRVVVEGGTDNPMAPSFDFLAKSYAPFVERAGAGLALALGRRGFYPAGGGRFVADVAPTRTLVFSDLLERGDVLGLRAVARVAHVPSSIGHRMLRVARDALGLDRDALELDDATGSVGPGVSMEIHVALASHTEVFTEIGEKGVPAETVASRCVAQAVAFVERDVPVGEHLADQLLLLAAIAGRGAFVTTEPTQHTRTQCEVIGRFLEVRTRIERDGARFVVSVG